MPKGTAIQVILDKEVKISKIGQPIHGRTVEPIYAFDKLVVPVGAEVSGTITELENVSGGKRTLQALNADFTPARKVGVAFDQLVFPDGKRMAMQTSVTPGSGEVISFVTATGHEQKKSVKDAASEKAEQAKAQAKQEWNNAVAQVEAPGKVHRAKRYLLAQLPVHAQYIDAGTVYFAELQTPLEFGSESFTPEMAKAIGSPPPDGSSVRARLSAAVSSATAQKGDEVDAVLSQPLFDGARLIFPQGSRLKGSVVEVQPARHPRHNGQLRIVFHEIVPPEGVAQKIASSLEGVQSSKSQDLKLDSEGGAEAQTPKTRYLQTAVAVGLAAASSGDDLLNHGEGGAGGFRVVGFVVGLASRSQPLGLAMGAFGASRSVYVHFIARGRDVVFPKNTAMEIGLGPRPDSPAQTKPAEDTVVQ
ncbi:MAG TPA: hypothetical protein VKF79_09005 [Candidatus Acidoferrum sp.]|nr:hypothetical protein [Candidatus Acidoferrum sp.]